MGDTREDLLSSASQAVRMERIEGQHNLLSSQLRASIDAMAALVGTTQNEIRAVSEKIGNVADFRFVQDANKAAIEDMKRSLHDINKRLEDWFDDFDERQQRRWETYERNRDEWRLRHEAENENDRKDSEREIRVVREQMIRAFGWSTGAGVLVTVVVGGFLYMLNERFTRTNADTTRVENSTVYNRQMIDQNRDDLKEIEVYLSAGGYNRERPYRTKQQRQPNGNAK